MWDLGYAASGLNDLNTFFGKTKSKFYLTEADLEKLDEPLGPRKRILRAISDSKKAEKATTESSTVCS
jgi:hypothetical protein